MATAGAAAPRRSLIVDAACILAAGFVLVLGASLWLSALGNLGWAFTLVAGSVYALVALAILASLGAHPFSRFGLPNIITTMRAAIASLFAGLCMEVDELAAPAMDVWAWSFSAAAAFALLLDGLDGYAARRLGCASSFGFHYDMEVDALLIFLLSALIYAVGDAGAWVMLIGLMRYVFVAAQFLWPALAAELPPSFRRKTVCVVQVSALGILLTPPVGPPFSSIIALLALLLLAWSFALDIRWLLSRRPRELSP